MQSPEIILSSGEALSPEEIMEGFLLLARAEASHPLLSAQDRQIACFMLVLAAIEFNSEEQII